MSWESWVAHRSRALAVAGIVLVVAVVTLGGIPTGAAPPPGSDGSVSGVVLDAGTGLPLAGICVNVENGPGAQTDGTGAYSVTGLQDGAYKVQFHDCTPTPQYLDQWYLGHDDSSSADTVPVTAGADTPLSDVQLTMGISVAGTVTDGFGTPVGGVQVNVNAVNPGQGTGVQTQPDGTYRTSPLPSGDYKVQFGDSTTPALAREFWNGKPSWNTSDTLTLASGDAPVHGGVDAQLPTAATIQGTVTGPGGSPLGGVCVNANVPNNGGWDWAAGTTTQPDGTYSLTQLPPGSFAIQFHDCNSGSIYIDQWYDNQQSFSEAQQIALSGGQVQTGVDAQLASGVAVAGMVTDSHGNPIAGINVNVNPVSSGTSGWAQTDSSGHYATSAVPPGDYRVQFSANGPNPPYATQFWNAKPSWKSADILTLTPGDAPTRAGVDAVLTASATVGGTVTGPNGDPVEGECVNAVTNTPNGLDGVADATTAADGTYALQGLPPGSFLIYFHDCNNTGPFLDQWWDHQPDSSTAVAVVVTAGSTTTGIDARLEAAGQIRGHVTDGDGHPLQGICAQATTPSAFGGFTHTDANGDYAISLSGPGAYKVQFIDCNETPTYAGQWWDDQPTAATAQVVDVAAGEVVDHVDAVLAPGAVSTVSGRVVNLNGTPMTGACVVAYAPSDFALFAPVQPDGTFQITDVPSGTYALAALGCGGGGDPIPTIADPQSPTTTFKALWWNAVPLSFDQQTQGGPDPIAQGASLVTIAPGQHLTGYDWCFGCTAVVISDITPGTESLTLAFDTPGLVIPEGGTAGTVSGASTGASAQAPTTLIYTASCVSTEAGAPGSATGTTTTLTVEGLTAGKSYTCQVRASDGSVTVASSAVSAAATRPGGASPVAGAGGTTAAPPSGALAFTGARASTLGWAAIVLLIMGMACIALSKRRPQETS